MNDFRKHLRTYHHYKKAALGTVVFPISIVLALTEAVFAETFTTPNFQITITRNCPEGYVTCNNVKYQGVNRKTGAAIVLKGKTIHSPGSDGTTPGRFLGYEFLNGNYRYVVAVEGDSGNLMVYRGSKLLLNEGGTIKY